MSRRPFSSSHKRLLVLIGSFSLAFLILVARLWHVTVVHRLSDETDSVRQTLKIARAPFVDRHGVLLATHVKTFSVYANPYLIPNRREAAQKLSQLFPDLHHRTLQKRLSAGRRFVWIARHVTPSDKDAILSLGIPGVSLMEDQRRIWPHGALCAHVLGLTNVDQIGISGLEKGLNAQAQNREEPLALSLDLRVQHIVRDELRRTIQTFSAEAGNALLIKVTTGEVIASVSLPDFNPHMPQQASPKALFNRNTTGAYEFGSILKIHNTAMLLESRLVHLNSVFDASKDLCLGRFRIKDFRGKYRLLTVKEAFLFSSNIANAKMALLAGAARQQSFFKKMGFWNPVPLETPESTHPLIPSTWREATVITASYGYGVALTPLHLVQSLSTILTSVKRPLTLLHQTKEVKGKPLLRQETAQHLRMLLHEATINGQATKAAVPGYAVGAKTGTCNLRNAQGRYMEKQNMTSCIGAFPIHDPQYILLVTVERPKPNHLTHGYATAGWIAAPLWSKIISRAAPLLGVLPEKDPELAEVFLDSQRSADPPLLLTTIDGLLKGD